MTNQLPITHKAQIMQSASRSFYCRILATNETVTAICMGNLLKFGDIVTGDFVDLVLEKNEWTIHSLLTRKNEIFRHIQRNKNKKIIASNCDILCIVVSASKPVYKRGLVDRFLIRSKQWNIPCIVLFNKMDEYNSDNFDINYESQRLKHLCLDVYHICAKDESFQSKYESKNYYELQNFLKGKTSLFLGASGVGKSKTIQLLTKSSIELKNQELGKSGKGKHTTTWAQIIQYDDYYFIDSPGIRSFSLEDVDKNDLIHYFPDLEPIALSCQFFNCHHASNAKGCAFFKEEHSEIIMDRLASFLSIYEELS